MAQQQPDLISQQFDVLRKRAKQTALSSSQQEREGLQRRFAALGQVNSGAQIRAESQVAQRGSERLQQAQESVNLAELGQRQQQQDIAEQRKFQTAERLSSQQFAAEQAGLGRQYSTGERLGSQQFQQQVLEAQQKYARGERLSSQDFAALQAAQGREYATSERLGSQQFASSEAGIGRQFQTQQAEFARNLQQQTLDLQRNAYSENIRQFDLEFNRDTVVIEFNKKLARDNASKNLLDDLGISGSGGPSGGYSGSQFFTKLFR